MSWKYANDEKTVVVRTNPNGSMESCLLETPEVQEWIAAGNEILPKDGEPANE